jgi:hypothetical protein
MSSVKIPQTGTDLQALQTGRFPPIPGMYDRFRMTGIDLSPDEVNELEVFEEFLERHVQPNRNRDVQCMLLWSEWVRTYRRHVPGFPDLIREREFQTVIMDRFSTEIATDGKRGFVYTGVQFLP